MKSPSADQRDLYQSDLFHAEYPDVANPMQPRRPPPNVPLTRAVRDAVEDVLEELAPDGLSWAWTIVSSPYVPASVVLVLSDCRSDDAQLTTSVLLCDDVALDTRNLRHCLEYFVVVPRSREQRSAA